MFYLLHGDSDDSWSTVGRAGLILDNLIAAKTARPMLVVMPAGHAVAQGSVIGTSATDAFVNDLVADLMPHVEKHWRVQTDRASTAIAGLSMGGAQTLAVARLTRFGYSGVFSSGLLNALPVAAAVVAPRQHRPQLRRPGRSSGRKPTPPISRMRSPRRGCVSSGSVPEKTTP